MLISVLFQSYFCSTFFLYFLLLSYFFYISSSKFVLLFFLYFLLLSYFFYIFIPTFHKGLLDRLGISNMPFVFPHTGIDEGPYAKADNAAASVYAFLWMWPKSTTSFILIVRYFTCRPNHEMGPIFYCAPTEGQLACSSKPRTRDHSVSSPRF